VNPPARQAHPWPTISGARFSITDVTPLPPNASLYSDQPTSPSSVLIFKKSKVRMPALACRHSSAVIFMVPPWRAELPYEET
jgi:hypothetical protein